MSPFIDPVLGYQWDMEINNALTDVVYLSELDATPPVSTMVLNAGEVFAHYVYTDDVSGSIVEASKPIKVLGWRNITQVPGGYPAGDQILEEMPPTDSWGRTYVAMPTAGRNWGDTFRIYGAQSDTAVYVNGRNLATIGRGQWIEHRTQKVETKVFTSTQPIMVQQYQNGQNIDDKPGDPSMLTLTPLEQGLSRYTIATPQYLPQPSNEWRQGETEFTNTLNIVAPEVAGVQIYVDGARVNNLVSSGLGFLTATVAISPGSHVATGTLPFVMSVTGLRQYESYAYPAGSSYQQLSSVSSLTLSPNTGTFPVAGGDKCFVATVENEDGTAAAGLAVYLYGPNGSIVASAEADADGEATLCYTGSVGDVGVTVVAGLLSVDADIRWVDGPSDNANLSGLVIAPGTLSPAFAAGTTSYAASVPLGTTSVAVTATTSDANATVSYASSAGPCSGTVKSCAVAGPKTWITTTVTAEDGTTKQYSIEITVKDGSESSDANLSGLTIAPGTLSPAFAGGTTSYTANVPDGTTSTTVTAEKSDANATVTYESSAGACSGTPPSCPLANPKTWITVTVTAEDGTTKQYSIEITVGDGVVSNDANLSGLVIAPGTLSPAFVSDTTSYTAIVPYGTDRVAVTATVNDAGATVTYASSAGSCSGTPKRCAVTGPKTWITATVTAEDGTTTEQYSIEIDMVDDASLSALDVTPGTLLPVFDADTLTYTTRVTSGVSSVTVDDAAGDPNATVTYESSAGACSGTPPTCPLNPGLNTITVTVTAEDGTTVREYVVEITRAAADASSDSTPTGLTIGGAPLTPAFAPGTTNYTATLPVGTSAVTVTTEAQGGQLTMAVVDEDGNQTLCALGEVANCPLKSGRNVIRVTVMAEDGTVTEYVLEVTVLADRKIWLPWGSRR